MTASFSYRRWRVLILAVIPLIIFANYLIFSHSATWNKAASLITPAKPGKDRPQPSIANSNDDTDRDWFNWTTPTRFHSPSTSSKSKDLCADFPKYLLSTIQIVLKVGAAENWARIDAQLGSVVKCIPTVLIVSDMDHKVGDHTAVDILADLPADTHLNEKDWEIYENQKRLRNQGNLKDSQGGWNLDKYKFIPQVERARRVNPTASWYVFLESDTYIVWDNLFRLLDNYDSNRPLYFGSPSPGRHVEPDETIWFAYGGPGFVLSVAAASRLVDRTSGDYGQWNMERASTQYMNDVKGDCCGDSMLGWALWDKKVKISGLWPMFNPHPLHGIPFSGLYWCQPVISLHKTHPEEFIKLWEWEGRRNRSKPLLYEDLIDFHELGNFEQRDDWDNADFDGWQEPEDNPAHESVKSCKKRCEDHGGCFSWTYHAKKCNFVRSIRYGQRAAPKGWGEDEKEGTKQEKRFHAGWDLAKIQDWKEKNKCAEAQWVKPSTERKF